MCCVCRERKDYRYFIRIYRTGKAPDYNYAIDETGKSNGRGCHICPTCIDKCVKTRALNRSFKNPVPQSIYDTLTKGTS